VIDFKQHPEIAMNEREFNPAVHKCTYRTDYAAIFEEIAAGREDAKSAYRWLALNDLFFITYFVMENPLMNCPFGVLACDMVQDNDPYSGYDVEIWARGHLKSFTMTQGQRVQRILRDPECCALILSYKKRRQTSLFLLLCRRWRSRY